ncbi:MFS transporter [Phenylobacterium sp. LjRoot219]|uniref:MFS transporter n=1 Tax=Phenylobacterium sp. LjRoot219 TaxID=3342283 RepID=UPI003ECD77E4
MTTQAFAAQPSGSGFIYRFMLLAVVSGASIALGRISTQLFAIHLGASPLQIGTIMAIEQGVMMAVAIPAGFLVSRLGVRTSYFTASLGPMLVYAAMPFAGTWGLLALARGLIGVCIPFRINSMNTSFLRELPRIGQSKAGWYRGSQTLGISLAGPALAAWVTGQFGYGAAFLASGVMFGLMGVASLTFFPETREPQDGAPKVGFLREVRQLLGKRSIFESCVTEHVSSATTSLFTTFILIIAIQQLGLPRPAAVSLLAFQGCTTAASLFVGSRLYVKMSRHGAYLWSLGVGSAALLCLGLGQSYALLAIGAVLLSLASSSLHFQNMTQLSLSSANKSKISGLYNVAGMSGGVIGSMSGGLLSRVAPLQSVYVLWVAVLLATAAAIALHNRWNLVDA